MQYSVHCDMLMLILFYKGTVLQEILRLVFFIFPQSWLYSVVSIFLRNYGDVRNSSCSPRWFNEYSRWFSKKIHIKIIRDLGEDDSWEKKIRSKKSRDTVPLSRRRTCNAGNTVEWGPSLSVSVLWHVCELYERGLWRGRHLICLRIAGL